MADRITKEQASGALIAIIRYYGVRHESARTLRAFIDQAPEATGEPVTVEALHDESGTVYLPVLRLGGVRLYGKERPRLRWAQAVADSVNAEFAPPQRPQGQEG